MYQRYGLAALPGMAWTANYQLTLLLHYWGAAILVFAVAFHIALAVMTKRFTIMPRKGDLKESAQIIAAMLGKGEEPPSHKYLAEQRVAYAFIGASTLLVIVSGLIKVVKNLAGVQMPFEVVNVATHVHNVSAVLVILGVMGHMVAFAVKENRALLPAMFDGTVDREYAAHRHSLWYAELDAQPTED
jgi:cytochrome b subunit of formate dehydrogenase